MSKELLALVAIIVTLSITAAGGLVGYGRLEGRVTAIETARAEDQGGIKQLSGEVRALTSKVDTLIGRIDERDRRVP